MGLQKSCFVVSGILCLVSAWYHELGVEQHFKFYHDRVTRDAGQSRYASFLVLSCLPQHSQYDQKFTYTTTMELLGTLFHCYHTRGYECNIGAFAKSLPPTTCQRRKYLRAPCGHIGLLTTHSLNKPRHKDKSAVLTCLWNITRYQEFAINLTVLTLNMPFTGHRIVRPLLKVTARTESGSSKWMYGREPPMTFISTSFLVNFVGLHMVDTIVRASYHVIPLPLMSETRHIYENLFHTKTLPQTYDSTTPKQMFFWHIGVYIAHVIELQASLSVQRREFGMLNVYDGPGVLSPIMYADCYLDDGSCYFTSTSFHVLVILGRDHRRGKFSLSYTTIEPPTNPYCPHFTPIPPDYRDIFTGTLHISETEVNEVLNTSKYGNYACVYRANNNQGRAFFSQLGSIQIIIQQFTYVGYTSGENFACIYGGLYFMLRSMPPTHRGESYESASNVCQSLIEGQAISVSADQEVVLAFYVYQGYIHTRASLTATYHVTNCWQTFLPWPDRLYWSAIRQGATWYKSWRQEWNQELTNYEYSNKGFICFRMDLHPYIRLDVVQAAGPAPVIKPHYNLGSMTSLTLLTRPNPFYGVSHEQVIHSFTDLEDVPAICTDSFLAALTLFETLDDTIGKRITLEDRQYTLRFKASSFTIELSECPWRDFYISISGEKEHNDQEIRPTTGHINWDAQYSIQMSTTGVKAAFLGITATWSVNNNFRYKYIPNSLGLSRFEKYVIITDIFMMYYRGECQDTTDNMILTVDVEHESATTVTNSSIRWFWDVFPRQPNTLVWRLSYRSQNNQFRFPNIKLRREYSGQFRLPPACDILMTAFRDTEKSFVSECVNKRGFFQLETGKCYHVQEKLEQTWYEAAAYCKSRGAVLASVDNERELYFLQRYFETLDTNNGIIIYGDFLYLGTYKQGRDWRSMAGHPVTFTDWNEPGLIYTRPVLLQAPGVSQDTTKVRQLRMLQSLWHPLNDNVSNCTAALYMHRDVRSSWVNIPCNITHSSRGLCSVSSVLATNNSDVESNSYTIGCKSNYISFRNYCYKIIFSTSTQLPLRKRNGHVATSACDPWYHVRTLEQHISFVKSLENYIFFSISSMLLDFELEEDNRSCIVSMTCSPMDSEHWTEVDQLSSCNASLARLFIDRPFMDSVGAENCPLGTYRCGTDTCISELYHCDGDSDCEDGSDETDCYAPCQLNTPTFDCRQCHPLNCSCSEMHYQCHSGGCIAADFLCDHVDHCNDASDELHCNYQPCEREKEFHCGRGQCIPKTRVCDMIVDCLNKHDEDNAVCPKGLCNGHRCLSGECIPKTWVNDLFPDCPGPVVDDEPELEAYPTNSSFKCLSNQLPCRMFHSKCYPTDLYCIYDFDADGHLYPCRNGGHLYDCSDIHCPGRYKCPGAYCIPTHRVCDGVTDCPHGQDETYCDNRTCEGLLKCKFSGLCVHKRNLHNSKIECVVSNEDEMLRDEECPSNCSCKGSAVTCTSRGLELVPDVPSGTKLLLLSGNKLHLNTESLSHLKALRILDVSNNELVYIEGNVFSSMNSLLKLDLSQNKITHLRRGHFLGLASLHFLSIQGNPVVTLTKRCFEGMWMLPVLDLQHQSLCNIEDGAFLGVNEVRHLNLSHNNIKKLLRYSFLGLDSLQSLDLTDNPFVFIQPSTFLTMKSLRKLYTDLYRLCCMQDEMTWCSARKFLVSTCTDLLGGQLLKSCTWFMGSLTVVGNVWVIIKQSAVLWTAKQKQTNKRSLQLPILFINLATSDMLYGLYLLILGAVDIKYKGNFMLHEDVWEKSWTCRLIGILAATSLDMSLCVLVLLALDQAHVVLAGFFYGYIRYHISVRKLATVLFLCWLILIVFALTYHITSNTLTETSGDSLQALCLATILTPKTGLHALDYSILSILTFRLFGCGSIIVCYISIARVSLQVSHSVDKSKVRGRRSTPYAKIALIILSNVAVSFTSSVLILLCLLGYSLDKKMVMWVVTVILPLNACMNPYLNNWNEIVTKLRKFCLFISQRFGKLQFSESP